jgi:hypothetical protein
LNREWCDYGLSPRRWFGVLLAWCKW